MPITVRNILGYREHSDPVVLVGSVSSVDFSAQRNELLAQLAVMALYTEAAVTPKPGLVDQHNTGAHDDMDFSMMIRSARSLYDSFLQAATLGMSLDDDQVLCAQLVALGRSAEQQMLAVTGGKNTHRGAIWSLGLLTVATARITPQISQAPQINVLAAGMRTRNCAFSSIRASYSARPSVTALLDECSRLAQGCVKLSADHHTHGQIVRRRYGTLGAREQASAGFPHVIRYALPMLYYARGIRLHDNDAAILSLLILMATVTDTCVVYRGGKDGLAQMHNTARCFFRAGNYDHAHIIAMTQEMDTLFCQHNLSPGGCADLLAVTLYIDSLITQGIINYPFGSWTALSQYIGDIINSEINRATLRRSRLNPYFDQQNDLLQKTYL